VAEEGVPWVAESTVEGPPDADASCGEAPGEDRDREADAPTMAETARTTIAASAISVR
jgi:hypothetical protein